MTIENLPKTVSRTKMLQYPMLARSILISSFALSQILFKTARSHRIEILEIVSRLPDACHKKNSA